MKAIEILFPYKHWCGVTIEDKIEHDYHDCNNWAHIVEAEKNEKL
jgi:hypothetical protein